MSVSSEEIQFQYDLAISQLESLVVYLLLINILKELPRNFNELAHQLFNCSGLCCIKSIEFYPPQFVYHIVVNYQIQRKTYFAPVKISLEPTYPDTPPKVQIETQNDIVFNDNFPYYLPGGVIDVELLIQNKKYIDLPTLTRCLSEAFSNVYPVCVASPELKNLREQCVKKIRTVAPDIINSLDRAINLAQQETEKIQSVATNVAKSSVNHTRYIEEQIETISQLDQSLTDLERVEENDPIDSLVDSIPVDELLEINGVRGKELLRIVSDMKSIDSIINHLSLLLQNDQLSAEQFVIITRRLSREYYLGHIMKIRYQRLNIVASSPGSNEGNNEEKKNMK